MAPLGREHFVSLAQKHPSFSTYEASITMANHRKTVTCVTDLRNSCVQSYGIPALNGLKGFCTTAAF